MNNIVGILTDEERYQLDRLISRKNALYELSLIKISDSIKKKILEDQSKAVVSIQCYLKELAIKKKWDVSYDEKLCVRENSKEVFKIADIHENCLR